MSLGGRLVPEEPMEGGVDSKALQSSQMVAKAM